MLKLLSPLEGTMTLLLLLGTYYSALSSIPSLPLFHFHAFVLQQAEVTLLKSTGEAFSYAYYVSVKDSFDANAYSDDPNENWSAPPWFSDPTGEVNCAVYDGNMGCVVWNLVGGGDLNDPCPDVVPYTPIPPPNLRPSVDSSAVEGYFSTLADELNSLLSRRGMQVSASISPTILGVYVLDVSMNYEGSASYLKKQDNPHFRWDFTVRSWEAPAREAYCECDYGNGYKIVATYELNGVYFGLDGYVDGVKLLSEDSRIPYIRYFVSVSKNYPPGTPADCRMVIP